MLLPGFSFGTFLLPISAAVCSGSRLREEPWASREILRMNSSIRTDWEGKNVLEDPGLAQYFSAKEPEARKTTISGSTTVGVAVQGSKQKGLFKNQVVEEVASRTYFMDLLGLSSNEASQFRPPSFI